MAGSSGGSGLGWVALVVLLVGGLWLYQREGGKVFDKSNFEPPPPTVQGVDARFDTGAFSHDLVLTHKHTLDPALRDVELTVVLYREDGTPLEVKKFWDRWMDNEAKKVNVPAQRYQKLSVSGWGTGWQVDRAPGADGKTAPNPRTIRYKIDESWTFTWDRK